MSIAFNEVGFNIGLLKEAKESSFDRLLDYPANKINLLADALNTERFAENYPRYELQECIDIRDDVIAPTVQRTDSELWGRVWSDYIVPTARHVGELISWFSGQYPLVMSAKAVDLAAWQRLVNVLAGWSRTPHLPEIFTKSYELKKTPKQAATLQ